MCSITSCSSIARVGPLTIRPPCAIIRALSETGSNERTAMRLLLAATAAAVAVAVPGTALGARVFGVATAATSRTSANAYGTFLINGTKAFPIGLTLPPPLGSRTPTGADALDEVVGSGVTFLRAGASGSAWTDAVLGDAQRWDAAAAARGAFTWINLRELGQAQPGTTAETMLQKVVGTLSLDPGFGLWKGVDEPWWVGVAPSALQFAYCVTTSRFDATWCDKTPSLDPNHLWVTIEAPRGTAAELQPYSAVTDTHGVDVYPVGINVADPDLHQVGTWTQTLASITPNHNVWTTLEICHSGSSDGTGNYVLPTAAQERYMAYDAIINGARALNFYGGRNANCFSATDSAYGWNWTFWNGVLKNLLLEIGPKSALYPAFLSPETSVPVTTNDAMTQAIARQLGTNEIWVLAARYGAGTSRVTFSGLPGWAKNATVYTESRTITARGGSWSDSFSRWGVHVYRFKR
jgi:hypothetical protein